ncbi:MAG TPA: phosphate acyltransferase PlsX [Methylomirabilota bacterium]|nr:phosphate acyltransferase PlsX [Methylomirabilota bacterium]
MRIVVDVMGGDHGPQTVVHGVKLALASVEQIEKVFLVGNQDDIQPALKNLALADSRLEIVHASQVLTMEDKPIEGIRKKKDSSILRAVELVRDGKGDAVISLGNTGGMLAAATIRLRNLEHVERAAIATIIPSSNSHFVLIDSGANTDCKPLHFLQFGIMGSLYAQAILGVAKPRVGILSNGSEDVKGTELTREAAKLCAQADLNFIGYVEGHDLFADEVDVVVTDGFVGNIVLKTVESMAKAIMGNLKKELTATPVRKLGAVIAQGAFKSLKTRMDPDLYGGAPLLGLNGIVIKAHGSAKERAIMNAIRVATVTAQHKVNHLISEQVGRVTQRLVPA